MKQNEFYFAALWLSVIMILVFFFQLLVQNYTALFVLNSSALQGEVWRFVSAIFLHGSAPHLLYNLFALLLFGFILERLIGTRYFLVVFFGSGIVANLVAVNFYNSSLGASGAIYGVLGAVAVLRPRMMVWVFGILLPMWLAVIVWIVGDAIGLFVPSNVGHIAHLSGIFVGLLLGILLRKRVGRRERKRNHVRLHEPSMRLWEERYMRR